MFGSVEVTCDSIHSSDGAMGQKGVKKTRPQVTERKWDRLDKKKAVVSCNRSKGGDE